LTQSNPILRSDEAPQPHRPFQSKQQAKTENETEKTQNDKYMMSLSGMKLFFFADNCHSALIQMQRAVIVQHRLLLTSSKQTLRNLRFRIRRISNREKQLVSLPTFAFFCKKNLENEHIQTFSRRKKFAKKKENKQTHCFCFCVFSPLDWTRLTRGLERGTKTSTSLPNSRSSTGTLS
jgi:hypothetical protein